MPASPSGRRLRHIIPVAACLIASAVSATALASPGMTPAPADSASLRADAIRELAPIPMEAKPGAPITITGGGTVPSLPRGTNFQGAAPAFATPLGGHAIKTSDPKQRSEATVTLYRADGSLYAKGSLSGNFYDHVDYYGSDGTVILSQSAERVTARPKGQGAKSQRTRASKKSITKQARKPVAKKSKNRVHRESATCSSPGSWAATSWRLYGGTMGFRISSTVPTNFILPILYAADNWNSMQNWCYQADQSNIALNYLGGALQTFGLDGVNVVDYGPAAGVGGVCVRPDAVGCAMSWVNGGYPYEIDIRLNSTNGWFVNGQTPLAGQVDVEGVMTHEFGHGLALLDVQSYAEVMAYVIPPANVDSRLLGMGDANFANGNY